jgi:hypothetical protein
MVVVTSDLDCPYNVERAHGRRPVHAFARSGRYSPRLGARPRSTASPAGPAGRHRTGEALPKRARAFNTDRTPSPAAPWRERLHERIADSIESGYHRFEQISHPAGIGAHQ